MPKISVVIPTYNRPEGLRRVLSSLREQTFSDFEVLIIEDGSNSGKAIVEEFEENLPIRYFWQENSGPARARNRGAREGKGEIIAYTDDDVKLPIDWLQRLWEGFKNYPEVAGVGGYMRAPDEVLKKSIFAQYEWYTSRVVYHADDQERVEGWESPIGGTNNIAYKKKIIAEVGYFDESFGIAAGEDGDLKKRITDKGYKLLYLPLMVEHYRHYGFKGFVEQSYIRGLGTYHFVTKYGGKFNKSEIYRRFLTLPLVFLRDLLDDGHRKFAVIKLVENFFVAWGLLKAIK